MAYGKFASENEPAFWSDMATMKNLRGWLGKSFLCPACGREHGLATRMMEESSNMAGRISGYLKELGLGKSCLVVLDENTKKAAGDQLMEGLAEYNPQSFVFRRPDLHADERSLGELLTAMSGRPDFLVACGSGTLTDITRYNSFMTGIPFVVFATAASVDGFASGSTPLLVNNFKTTYPGVAPLGIFYDPAVLARAPQEMTAAGFGDVLAKLTALLDWRLAFAAEDEAYCPLIAALVDRAVADCLGLAEDLAAGADLERKGRACSRLMEVLSLTGLAMQLMGSSRPASGSDHQISHLLEMRDVQQGRTGSLHGDKVGIGTLIGMYMYTRLFAGGRMPEQKKTMPPDVWRREVHRVYGPMAERALAINPDRPPAGRVWQEQKEQLEKAMHSFGFAAVERFRALLPQARDKISLVGGPTRPDQLGYTEQEVYDAIAFGKENRPKFTTLRLAERYGWLYELAVEIAWGLPRGDIY